MIKKTKRVYRLTGISIKQDIIPYHLALCGESNTRKSIPILCEKYTHLIHSLIRRITVNEEQVANMNAEIMKSLYGNDYLMMIKTLCDKLGYFSRNYYEIGKHSYDFRFKDERIKYETTYEYPTYLGKYEEKLDTLLSKKKEDSSIKAKEEMGSKFFKDYTQSLGMLRMPYADLAEEFVCLHHFPRQEQHDCYLQIIEEYGNFKKPYIKIDHNNRIYHILTRTPRLLKPFLNIKFSCDIHNSHPLLFVSLIYDYHGVPIPLRQEINSILNEITITKDKDSLIINIPTTIFDVQLYTSYSINDPNILQYVYEFVRDRLANSNLDIQFKTNNCISFSYDEIFYILLVSKGVFWDFVIPSQICNENGLTRSDVKVTMFQEVFYSNKRGAAWKQFAMLFQQMFPHVFELTERLKFGTSHVNQKPSEWLSGEMTKLESALFWEILKRLYKKRYKAINIHDAIVILDVKGNNKCTESEVCAIIKQVYWEDGLLANIGVDHYGKDYAFECIENERIIQSKADLYLKEQKENAAKSDQDSSNFVQQYEAGKVELIFSKDGSSPIIHSLKRRPRKALHRNRTSLTAREESNPVIINRSGQSVF